MKMRAKALARARVRARAREKTEESENQDESERTEACSQKILLKKQHGMFLDRVGILHDLALVMKDESLVAVSEIQNNLSQSTFFTFFYRVISSILHLTLYLKKTQQKKKRI